MIRSALATAYVRRGGRMWWAEVGLAAAECLSCRGRGLVISSVLFALGSSPPLLLRPPHHPPLWRIGIVASFGVAPCSPRSDPCGPRVLCCVAPPHTSCSTHEEVVAVAGMERGSGQ
jgi:hypothetical protein